MTSKRNFEGAVTTNDVVTFKVGVSGLSNTVSSVIVNGVSATFTNTGSYVYFDARVTTNSQTITLSLQPNTAPIGNSTLPPKQRSPISSSSTSPMSGREPGRIANAKPRNR